MGAPLVGYCGISLCDQKHLKASMGPYLWLPSSSSHCPSGFLHFDCQLLSVSVFCQITAPLLLCESPRRTYCWNSTAADFTLMPYYSSLKCQSSDWIMTVQKLQSLTGSHGIRARGDEGVTGILKDCTSTHQVLCWGDPYLMLLRQFNIFNLQLSFFWLRGNSTLLGELKTKVSRRDHLVAAIWTTLNSLSDCWAVRLTCSPSFHRRISFQNFLSASGLGAPCL